MKGHLGDGVNKRKTILVTSLIASQLFAPAFCAPVETESRSDWSESKNDHVKEEYRDEAVVKALKVNNFLKNGVESTADAAQIKLEEFSDKLSHRIDKGADKVKGAKQKIVDNASRVKDIKDALLYGASPSHPSDTLDKRGIIIISGNQQPSIKVDATEDNDYSSSEGSDDMQDQIDILNKLKANGLIDVYQMQKPTEVVEEDGNDMVAPHLLILGVPAGPMQPMEKRCDKGEAEEVDADEEDDDEGSDDEEDDDEEGCNSLDQRDQDETELARRAFVPNLIGSAVGTYVGSALHAKYKRRKAKKRAKNARRDRRNGKYRDDDDDRDYYKRSPVAENNGKKPMENGPSSSATGAGHEGAAPPPPPPPARPPPAPSVEEPVPVVGPIAGKPVKIGDTFLSKTGKILTAIGAAGGAIYLVDLTHRLYNNYNDSGDENTKRDVEEDASEYESLPVKRAVEVTPLLRRDGAEEDDGDEEYFDAEEETLERRGFFNLFGGAKPVVEKPVIASPATSGPVSSPPSAPQPVTPPTAAQQPIVPIEASKVVTEKKTMSNHLATAGKVVAGVGALGLVTGTAYTVGKSNGQDDEKRRLRLQRRALFGKAKTNAVEGQQKEVKPMSKTKKVLAAAGAVGVVGTAFGIGHHFGRKDEKRRLSRYSKREDEEDEESNDENDVDGNEDYLEDGIDAEIEEEDGNDDANDDDEMLERRWFNWGRAKATPPVEAPTVGTTSGEAVASKEALVNDVKEKKPNSALAMTGKVAAGLGAVGLIGAAGYGTAKLFHGGSNRDDNYKKREVAWSRDDTPMKRSVNSTQSTPLLGEVSNVDSPPSYQAAIISEAGSNAKEHLLDHIEAKKSTRSKSKGDIVINSKEVTINQ